MIFVSLSSPVDWCRVVCLCTFPLIQGWYDVTYRYRAVKLKGIFFFFLPLVQKNKNAGLDTSYDFVGLASLNFNLIMQDKDSAAVFLHLAGPVCGHTQSLYGP